MHPSCTFFRQSVSVRHSLWSSAHIRSSPAHLLSDSLSDFSFLIRSSPVHLSVLCRLHPTFAPIDSFHFMHQAPPPNVWCIIHKTAAYVKIEPLRLKAVVEIELTAISKPWDGYIVSPTWTVPRDPKINIDIISRTLAGRVDKTDHM